MNTQNSNQNPSSIMSLATAYWSSQVLLTANRVNLFERLSQSEKSVDQIASDLGTHVRPTLLLLNACVALGFLEKIQNKFSNTQLAETFLVPGRPTFMGNAISYSDDLYETWGKLELCLHENTPMLPPENYLGTDDEKTRHFVYGMHNRALGTASVLVDLVDLSGRKQMLDVGGGPGTYSCLLTDRYPELNSKVLDLPGITAHADNIIASMGKQTQVTTYPGDYHTTEFPKGNDVVLISGVFHRETEADCKKLIQKATDCLNKNGMLVISDVFSDEGGSSPVFATLFALNMLLTAENGGVHSDTSVTQWMRDVGFNEIQTKIFPQPMPHRVVIGYKN